MQGEGDREAASRIVIEPFDPARPERLGFSCGTGRLDNFLQLSARKRQQDDFTRVFVAVAAATGGGDSGHAKGMRSERPVHDFVRSLAVRCQRPHITTSGCT